MISPTCDYVLPCLSYMETYDTTSFNFSYPDLFFQMRQPFLEPLIEESREGSAIMLELAKTLGFLPELPGSLYEAAEKGITTYLAALSVYLEENPQHSRIIPLILAETLGRALGSVNQSLIVGLLAGSCPAFKAGAAAVGYPEDFTMVENIFKDILKHPEGLYPARFGGDNFSMLQTA